MFFDVHSVFVVVDYSLFSFAVSEMGVCESYDLYLICDARSFKCVWKYVCLVMQMLHVSVKCAASCNA